jgi:hypothetical protein
MDIVLNVVRIVLPLIFLVYTFIMVRNIKLMRKRHREIMEDYVRHSREIAMSQFLLNNPEIDPEIFIEKKKPIVPKKDKVRHHFNHKGGDYFM